MRQTVWLYLIGALLLGSALSQNCTIADQDKTDCGYYGINQAQCQAKGCCWQPANNFYEMFMKRGSENGIPWCFFPVGKNPCQNLNFNGTSGPGFDQNFYDSMYQKFIANINIGGQGGVVASPDNNTAGGSYYYDWMRDESLTMRTFMEINDMDLSKIQSKMDTWTQWVLRLQNEPDPNDIDVRIEPKFFLPNGSVYTGPWCRPQTDGPALRAAALIMFANTLLSNGQGDYVRKYLWTGSSAYNGGAIKYDIEWVASNWPQNGCDLWEEIRSDNFFWNRMAFQHALNLAATFASRMGDQESSARYTSVKNQIQNTLNGHWTGSYMMESTNRQKDSAVIHAFSSLNVSSFYPQDSPYVAGTVNTLNQLFCSSYQVNQDDNAKGLPGILYGRYEGDNYDGGNPWQLLTAVLGELFYQIASTYSQRPANYTVSTEVVNAWSKIFSLSPGATNELFAKAALRAGDAVLYRLYQHVKDDNGVIYEQINRSTGKQQNAYNLTWSFANILRALHFRNTKLKGLIDAMEKSG